MINQENSHQQHKYTKKYIGKQGTLKVNVQHNVHAPYIAFYPRIYSQTKIKILHGSFK